MNCLVAIEADPKSSKIILECFSDIAKDSGSKVHIFDKLETFATEMLKPENCNDTVSVLMVPIESLGSDPVKAAEDLKAKYKTEILVTLFDDPSQPVKKLRASIIKNLIYKPFDPTIFKEHTRFVLFPSQKVKTQFVHTTVSKSKLEYLKKFNFTQLSEAGFKIGKEYPLVVGNAYKFYHPLFQHQKVQHAWGRIVNEDVNSYEVAFVKITAAALSNIRRKIVGTKLRFKNPQWRGVLKNTQAGIDIVIHIEDEATSSTIQQLIERTFTSNLIMHKKDFKSADKITADLLITDITYEEAALKNEFTRVPTIIRLQQENLTRVELEASLQIEFCRLEKPLDKAFLIKVLKTIYPMMQEKEVSYITTVPNEGTIVISEEMVVEEFSEAALGFNYLEKFNLDQMVDIALTQEDESDLKEMKIKIHYADEKASPEKLYYHQAILYGMKDEFLKQMRLWTLQMHIEKNKNK